MTTVKVGDTNYYFVASLVEDDDNGTPVVVAGATLRCVYCISGGPELEAPGSILAVDPRSGSPLAQNQVAWQHPPDADSIFIQEGIYSFMIEVVNEKGTSTSDPHKVLVKRGWSGES
ncbi:exonuclease [Desulfofustis phage LS06-2018-MD02]|jgi:hypothetical protein|nr:exonuclease [Desulfofustis phage LS06-2018-MD02]